MMEEREATSLEDKGRMKTGDIAVLLLVSFLGITRVWVGGYRFGVADNAWQVPAVRALATGEFSHDYIFQAPPKLSLFFASFAFLGRRLAIEPLYFAAYVSASMASTVALFLLARRMLASPSAALLAVLLLLTRKQVVAGANTWDPLFLPRVAAMPFLLLGWLYLLKGRFANAGLLLGGAFAVHPLTGLYGGAIGVLTIVISRPRCGRPLGRFAAGAAPLVLLALWYARGTGAPILNASADWYRAMLVRNLHHLKPTGFPRMAGLLLFGLWAGSSFGWGKDSKRCDLLLGATAAAAIVFMYFAAAETFGRIIGLAEPERALLNPPALAVLQPLRISGVFGILVLIAIAGVMWQGAGKGLLGRLAMAGAAVALFFAHLVVGVIFLAAVILAGRGTSRSRSAGVIAVMIAGLVVSLVFHKTLLVLLFAVGGLSIISTGVLRGMLITPAAATLGVLVVIVGVLPVKWAPLAARRVFGDGVNVETSRYVHPIRLTVSGNAAFLEASAWISENVRPDEITIIPPWWEGFRAASGRPVFGTYKDGTLIFFDEDLAGEWLARMSLVGMRLAENTGPNLPRCERNAYAVLDERQVLEAARRFGAAYIVRPEGGLPGFAQVYAGHHVHIYRIPAAAAGAER
ncbi:MAG: hypothetical protein J7M19_02400 [Planctomycetes bacterium]|nr:hypothetical protein [Planctomycetota bacterium]